jgi:hypothetical protein
VTAGGEDPGVTSTRRRAAQESVATRIVRSVAVLAATAGLAAFATFGSFEDGEDPFPRSVGGSVGSPR